MLTYLKPYDTQGYWTRDSIALVFPPWGQSWYKSAIVRNTWKRMNGHVRELDCVSSIYLFLHQLRQMPIYPKYFPHRGKTKWLHWLTLKQINPRTLLKVMTGFGCILIMVKHILYPMSNSDSSLRKIARICLSSMSGFVASSSSLGNAKSAALKSGRSTCVVRGGKGWK